MQLSRIENAVLLLNARHLKHLPCVNFIYIYMKNHMYMKIIYIYMKKHSFSSKEIKLHMQHFLEALNKSICPAYFAKAAEKTAS